MDKLELVKEAIKEWGGDASKAVETCWKIAIAIAEVSDLPPEGIKWAMKSIRKGVATEKPISDVQKIALNDIIKRFAKEGITYEQLAIEALGKDVHIPCKPALLNYAGALKIIRFANTKLGTMENIYMINSNE